MGRFSEFEIRLPAMLHPSPKLMDLGPKEGLHEMKADHFQALLISVAFVVVVSWFYNPLSLGPQKIQILITFIIILTY